MSVLVKIVPLLLYILIGAISLIMAFISLFSRKFLPFHEAAYGKQWKEIEKNLQYVILALLRISGLGFLIVAILLLSAPIFNYFQPGFYIKYVIPVIALIVCTGLFIFNFILYRKTGVTTPWKNSILVMAVIIICIILSGL
jgi:hypothetical protein